MSPVYPDDAPQCVAIVACIDQLRADEGATVTLCSDNADFNGLPNCAVEVTDAWTAYRPETFRADTLLEALQLACAAKERAPAWHPSLGGT